MKDFAIVKEEHPVVQTHLGNVMGENRSGVAIFRGIPYGDTTAGEYRFEAPREAPCWEGVRDCYTGNGHVAPQNSVGSVSQPDIPYWNGGTPEKFKTETETQDEDCLCLNVVTPGIDDKKRAVAVYFHGGGFATGSGTLVLGADDWAREQDIVLVGVNHRLNIFGYMYLGAVDERYKSSGMAGILDAVLALKWVQKNIAAFGGDPEKVTIMGESGGGMKVSTLMDMAECKGLFRAGIVISGSSPTGALSREAASKVTEAVMERLGAKTVDDLKRATVRELLDACAAGPGFRFSPVADDVHLMSNNTGTFRKSALDLPLLVGSSEDEIGVFLAKEQLEFGWDELRERVLAYSGNARTPGIPEDKVDELIDLFKRTDTKNNDAPHLFVKICSLGGTLGGGAFYQAMCASANNTSPVYHYVIRYDAPYERDLTRHLAWHTADLPLTMRIVTYPEDCLRMSMYYSAAWANFIKDLDPSTDSVKWERFMPDTKRVMVIDDEQYMATDPLREIREAYEKIRG